MAHHHLRAQLRLLGDRRASRPSLFRLHPAPKRSENLRSLRPSRTAHAIQNALRLLRLGTRMRHTQGDDQIRPRRAENHLRPMSAPAVVVALASGSSLRHPCPDETAAKAISWDARLAICLSRSPFRPIASPWTNGRASGFRSTGRGPPEVRPSQCWSSRTAPTMPLLRRTPRDKSKWPIR